MEENYLKPSTLSMTVLPVMWAVALCAVTMGAEPIVPPEPHPLDPVIRWAEDTLVRTEQIEDYTALLVKRERVGEQLQEHQFMQLKVRHEPFSVYLKFLQPASVRGREIIYVEGRHDGKLLAHDGGGLTEIVGTVKLDPEGMIAMRGQRYPVTMIGVKSLALKLIEQAKADREVPAPCDVKWFHGAKVNGCPTLCVEVSHPVRHPAHQFALARVYVDHSLGIPIRYEGYTWPETEGRPAELVEEYTYCQLKVNVGLTDNDFDPKNPQYRFP